VNVPAVVPDKAQIQRLIAFGSDAHGCRHYILQVQDPAKALAFIEKMVGSRLITDASLDKIALAARFAHGAYSVVSIGFTYRGLQALGLPRAYLRVFQEKTAAFSEGAYFRAASRLADTGASAAPNWETSFRPDKAHVLITLHADDDAQMDAMVNTLMPGDSGMAGWCKPQRGRHLKDDREARTAHFGVRDGISNPAIKGIHPSIITASGKPRANLYAAGEFLLGYPNEKSFNPWLLINPSPVPNPWLKPLSPVDQAFFRNASFGVLRKIEQDEATFLRFVQTQSTRLGVSTEYVKAKLIGRWTDGSVVRPGATSSEGVRVGDDLNQFDFSDDVRGEGCPFGAHIRRMNPRADAIVPFRKRPLIRRGMPYGELFDKSPEERRGLLGLFFCASLEDQFEHLLAAWANANPMGPRNRGNAKDPMVGHHQDPHAVFDIPLPPSEETLRRISGFTPFVTTRGTLYAFFPSLGALGMLPDLCKPAK
jgi:deferrochelatase/peroxidase EfeB